MSPEEIRRRNRRSPGGSARAAPFATDGADPPPAWSDFADPLDAIAARFRPRDARRRRRPLHASASGDALGVLGLKDDVDRTALRQRYSELVRRYHPDRNGGDRSLETQARASDRGLSDAQGARAPSPDHYFAAEREIDADADLGAC